MKRRIFIILTTYIALLCSCVHKNLCLEHLHEGSTTVRFDWKNAPEAHPAGMCVFFYPVNGGTPIRYDFRGKEGGRISVKEGRYIILSYNNDLEGVLFRGTHELHSHEAFTREGHVLESIYGNSYAPPSQQGKNDGDEEKTVICPDMMWGCTSEEIKIADEGIEQTITLYPEELTSIYTYEIRNVKNLNCATQMCASLSGMAGGLMLSTLTLSSAPVTLPLESYSDRESTISGSFITFGHNERNEAPHRMLLYVWMNDGKQYIFGAEEDHFDVTEQIHTAPDKRRVNIIIDGLELPESEGNEEGGGEFNPSIDDWEDIIYEDIYV